MKAATVVAASAVIAFMDRSTTERLLLAVGARKSDLAEEWTLNPL
jgi:hypothetical protein